MICMVVKRTTTSSHQSTIDTRHFPPDSDRGQINGVGYQSLSTYHASSHFQPAADIKGAVPVPPSAPIHLPAGFGEKVDCLSKAAGW